LDLILAIGNIKMTKPFKEASASFFYALYTWSRLARILLSLSLIRDSGFYIFHNLIESFFGRMVSN